MGQVDTRLFTYYMNIANIPFYIQAQLSTLHEINRLLKAGSVNQSIGNVLWLKPLPSS